MIGQAGRGILGDNLYNRIRASRQPEHRFLRRVRGVIHVGANTGQEAELYDSFGLDVLWIEPIPEIFEKLQQHVSQFPKQKSCNYLVGDEDGVDHSLHVSNNGGESSSILDFADHSKMWPGVAFTHAIKISGIRLETLLSREQVNVAKFDALILDTQGSELRILRGASSLLQKFKFVKVEVPDFESYKGCCRLNELSEFMHSNHFIEYSRIPFMYTADLGTYFDVIYKRERH